MQHVADHPSLRTLSCNADSNATTNPPAWTAPNLVSLELVWTGINVNLLAHILTNSPQLRSLKVDFNTSFPALTLAIGNAPPTLRHSRWLEHSTQVLTIPHEAEAVLARLHACAQSLLLYCSAENKCRFQLRGFSFDKQRLLDVLNPNLRALSLESPSNSSPEAILRYLLRMSSRLERFNFVQADKMQDVPKLFEVLYTPLRP